MATVTPQQQQLNQIAAQLQAAQQQAQRIASAVQALSQARQMGMTITPNTTVEQARQYLAAKTASSAPLSQQTTTPALTTTDFQSQMATLQRALAGMSMANPPSTGLSAQERALYEQTLQQLKDRYQQELANLERKQQEEKQRLIGRYAAAGFSEPGIIEGPTAGIPGVVTKALQELGEQQARGRAQLQQAAAGDITAVQLAQAEAERRAQEKAYNQWAKEQQRKLENILKQAGLLETIYGYAAPQRMTVGGRILEYDPITNTYKDVTPAAITEAIKQEETEKAWSLEIDNEGNVWRVNPLTGQMQRIGKVAVTPKATEEKWQIKIDENGNVWRINPITGKVEKIGGVEAKPKNPFK